jgi:hypothetical protein
MNVFMTGWHNCVAGFELKPGFNGCDVECLSAPTFIPAGSTLVTETGAVVGTFYHGYAFMSRLGS